MNQSELEQESTKGLLVVSDQMVYRHVAATLAQSIAGTMRPGEHPEVDQ